MRIVTQVVFVALGLFLPPFVLQALTLLEFAILHVHLGLLFATICMIPAIVGNSFAIIVLTLVLDDFLTIEPLRARNGVIVDLSEYWIDHDVPAVVLVLVILGALLLLTGEWQSISTARQFGWAEAQRWLLFAVLAAIPPSLIGLLHSYIKHG